MGLHYVCQACGRRLTVPEELYASKIRGRVVTVKCKGCGAPVGIDGTAPPPAIEATSNSVNPKPDELDSGLTSSASESTISLTASDEPSADKVQIRKSPVDKNDASQTKAAANGPKRSKTMKESSSAKADTRKSGDESKPAAKKVRSESKPDKLVEADAPGKKTVNDEPENGSRAIDESWDTAPADDDSSRFSHVDGPIPIRLPTARIGRYALFDQFAEGGIATVHFGRIDGAGGFSRIVAIKRLHPHLAENDEFTEMLLKEARLAARVRHPNVVPTLDVVASQGDVLLILEYVHGESLSALCRTQAKFIKDHLPVDIAVAVMLDVLSGLGAVHEATNEKGRLLGLVHRDISPPNVVVGADGFSRVLDFGIAKALEHIEESMPSRLKGKIGYMAPEQIRGEGATQRSDVFAAGVILWELLATRRLFASGTESERMKEIVAGNYPRLSRYRPGLSRQLEQVTMRALDLDPNARFGNSREFAEALEQAAGRASARRVAKWVTDLAAKTLADRARMIAQVENWNAGPEIPLNSSPFAEDNHYPTTGAPTAITNTPGAVTTTPPPVATNANRESQSAMPSTAIAKKKHGSSSSNTHWLLLLSCLILFVALYYTIWR